MRYLEVGVDRIHDWLDAKGRGLEWSGIPGSHSSPWWIQLPFTELQSMGGRASLGKGTEFGFGVLSLRCLWVIQK